MTDNEKIARIQRELGLTHGQCQTFLLLAERPGWIVTYDRFADRLWPEPDELPEDFHDAVWCRISRLRRRLPEGLAIVRHYGIGYSLTVPKGWVRPWE
ncbi:winged helix-turn-helix domain-containing protein [Pseudooceanicola sp. C21-150M6]|uniref:winged helix-turn-helix domain-containing protein n=1 Tax=Pseudooceanicola sp. C21-150M6 TaxID=3434355 RepID=UPI003D7FDBDC